MSVKSFLSIFTNNLLNIQYMGKASEGILGPVNGKVGNLVWYTMYGKNVVRMAPSKRTGKKTEKEKNNTGKFAKVQAFMSPISAFVKLGFKDYGTKTGGYRAAVSYGLNHAVTGEYPDQYVDPGLVRISGGDLHAPVFSEAVLDENYLLRFNWSTETGSKGNRYDQAMLLAYALEDEDNTSADVVGITTGVLRKAGTDALQLSPARIDLEYHVYLGFLAQDRSCQSHSVYLGKVSVPKR